MSDEISFRHDLQNQLPERKMKKFYVLTLLSFCLFLHSGFSQTLKSVVNQYTTVTGPANISAGDLSVTVTDPTIFQAGSRALIMQMKGATASTVNATYGNITAINNAGNYEFLDVTSVSGTTITFQRCLQKNYTVAGLVQLITVPKYTGNQTVMANDSISTIRVYNKGYGYTVAPVVTISGPTGTPAGDRVTATAVAELDVYGQVKAIRLTNRGRKYITNPTVTISRPGGLYNFGAYQALAVASRGLTGMQWDGEKGGVLAFEVDGGLALSDSILMNGMGFGGGSLGTGNSGFGCITTEGIGFGTVPPPTSPASLVPEPSLAQSAAKGEGVAIQGNTQMRGRGKFSSGGGAGCRGEAGGGGGGNFGVGGIGGKAGAGGATGCNNTANPSGRGGADLSSYGYGEFASNKIFFGGGGGNAFNGTYSGASGNNSGGFGGGIIIISATSITGNGRAIKANGGSCGTIASDGASGGGGGGVVMLDCDSYNSTLIVQAMGGKGGNTDRLGCCTSPTPCASACGNKEGPGGGGGGGVVWLASTTVPSGVTTTTTGGTGGLCTDQGNDPYGATSGSDGTTLFELYLLKGEPFLGSTFTVGPVGTTPRPNFSSIKQAADYVSNYGASAAAITFDVMDGTYSDQVTFKALTDGCNLTGGALTVQSNSANPANVIMSSTSDVAIVNGLADLTLKNITCSASTTTARAIQVTNASSVLMENVDLQGTLEIDQAGINSVELNNSNHTGNIEAETNSSLTISGFSKIVGQASSNRGIILSSGASFIQTANSVLELEGANWTNNGATLSLDNASSTLFSGGFAMSVGGTSPTAFRRVMVSNTNSITVGNSLSMKKWLQTSNASTSAATHTISISDSILTGTGQISHSTGKVILTNSGASPAVVQGKFYNLDLNNTNSHTANGDITVDNIINLNAGLLNLGSNILFTENSNPGSLVSAVGSWITGTVRRKVSTGNYTFPIGTPTTKEPVYISLNSLSGGMQYLAASFSSTDPMVNPVSTFTPKTEGLAQYSGLISPGLWTLTPDAGSADYDLRLFPSFIGSSTPPYSIYKRPTASTVWDLYGTLSNPEAATDYIQSDGSLRRTGLTGFSDFAITESNNDPLPLHFLSFQARPVSKGVLLRWKTGDCQRDDRFTILRGKTYSTLSKINLDIKPVVGCSDFQAMDPNIRSGVWFYKVQGQSENNGKLYSDLQRIDFEDVEKPILSNMDNEKVFTLKAPSFEFGSMMIVDLTGKTLFQTQSVKQDQRLDFSTFPAGIYFSIFDLDGEKYRQKFVIW